jgi:uncharacterized membrane protein
MRFGPGLRKLTYTTHITTSVGWIGAALVFVAMAGIGLLSEDERTVRGAYLLMAPAGWLVLVPLAHASLLSGIALSLGTPWGLFRHYWIVLKLLITAFCTVILMIYMGTFRQMAGVAADPVVELGLVRNPSPLVHSVMALVLLVTATVLGVYKPFGMTPYGARNGEIKQSAFLPPAARAEANSRVQWFYIAALVLALLAIVFIVAHLLGGQLHSH